MELQQIDRSRASVLQEAEGTMISRQMDGPSTVIALRRRTTISLMLATALLGAACSSDPSTTAPPTQQPSATEPGSSSLSAATEGLQPCVPACGESDLVVPGDLPAGEYQTQWFFGGQMTLTLPDGWTSPEDSTGEFLVQPLADPDVSIAFWEDVYPVEPNTVKRIETVPITRAGLVDWLMANPNLEVSNPAPATIRRSSRDDRRPQGRR